MQKFDAFLHSPKVGVNLSPTTRFAVEFLFFGMKEARACLFAGLFFTAVFAVPRGGVWLMPRYDALLVIALAIQGWMVWAKLETVDELKAISLFHLVGFALEVFKTSSGIKSWAYPDFAIRKCWESHCSRGLCMPGSAVSLSNHGGCWICG